MRRSASIAARLALIVVAAACTEDINSVGDITAPTGLFYELEPSGDPFEPRGLVLRWDPVNHPDLAVYNVYSRGSTTEAFSLRGSTTSTSFHDDGQPHLEYYVTAEDLGGFESEGSSVVVIDESLRLPAPTGLFSISLDRAIHLEWNDNAFNADPNGFRAYRVYSTSYDLDNNVCGASWTLEGTSIANTFLVGALTNGVPRCFAVSALTIEGFESLWSSLRNDTPRPDGHNVVVFTAAADAQRSGFRFFFDLNNDGLAGPLELGIVGPASGGNLDFTLGTGAGGLFLTPQRAPTRVLQYGAGPIGSLADIDIAPVSGYARTALLAQSGYGYVFEITQGAGLPLLYGAIRVSAVGADYVIFDWSYQTDPGNPELIRIGGGA